MPATDQVAGSDSKGRKATVPHEGQACAAQDSPLVINRRRFLGHSLPFDHQRCCQENPTSTKPGLVPRTPIAPGTICSPQAGHVIPTVIDGNLSTPCPTKIGHSFGGTPTCVGRAVRQIWAGNLDRNRLGRRDESCPKAGVGRFLSRSRAASNARYGRITRGAAAHRSSDLGAFPTAVYERGGKEANVG